MNFEKIDRKWRFRFQSETLDAIFADLRKMRGFEAHWRLARAYHFAAMQKLENGEGETAKIALRRGWENAKWAYSLEPKRVEGHFWMAVCGIERARLCGKTSTAWALWGAKRQLRIALSLDEAFHFAGSHRVLGRIFHLAPRVLGGNDEKAEEHFRRALEIADNSTTRLYFGELLLSRGEWREANAQFEAIITAPRDDDWVWEQARDRALARVHLKR